MTLTTPAPPVASPPPGPVRAAGRERLLRAFSLLLGAGIALAAGIAVVPHQPAGRDRQELDALRTAQTIAVKHGATAAAVTSSAVSSPGRGEFSDLRVTVGQTTDLTNQSVVVTWKWGGADPGQHATIRAGSTPNANFLQLMQCWGDTAPDRTRCEFGGVQSLNQSGSTFSASRRIFPPGPTANIRQPIDPLETFCWPVTQAPDVSCPDTGQRDFLFQGDQGTPGTQWAVPFKTVAGETFRHDKEAINPFFSEFDTNEVPYAVTGRDGTGFETFETQTFRESTGLGCADVITSGPLKGKPRSCWLVVVPRGTTEVDGKDYLDPEGPNGILQSSPLSLTNWNNRIQFRLGFQPIGQPCPISAEQRLVGGVETSAEAVLRWQPALCRNGGAVYGYSKLGDAVTEGALTGTGSTRGLSFLNAPVDPAAVPPDRTLVYAPMAISGVAFSAIVEISPRTTAPPEVKDRAGSRVADIRLTPRLVAKLLTQSYGRMLDFQDPPGYIRGNPESIDVDPEFLAANPAFKDYQATNFQLMMPTGVAFTARTLWSWLQTDDQARDFLAGVPDESGMRVNPFYQGLDLPQETFPKIDPFCRHDFSRNQWPNLCVFDLNPAVADFRETARQTARGDTLQLNWPSGDKDPNDPNAPLFVRRPREQSGGRLIGGVTDTATAARFQLVNVQLRNAAGRFVAPTSRTMLAAVAGMTPSPVKGVLTPNPRTTIPDAYPLTVVTYAVSAPIKLSVDAARDYATFIRYAAGPGQTPGTGAGSLPEGYAPLPAAMRRQALAAADQVQRRVGPPPVSTPSSPSEPSSPPSSPPSTAPSSAPPAPAPSPAATTPVALPPQTAVAARTPGDAEVNRFARYAMIAALLLGSGGLLIAPLLPRIAERLRR